MFWELPEVSLLGTIRVFCSIAGSRFGCAIFPRTLRSVLWLFTYCVWDVLRYRILIKTDFVSWAKQKLSKTTLCTFQKCLFELCSAGFFGCKKRSCFENLLRSLYMKQYVLFVQMPRHLLAAVFFERYVRYFGSLPPAFEMSCDTEHLEKNSFWFFRKRGLRRFGLCAIVLMIFVQTVRKIMGDLTGRTTPTLQNDVEYVPKRSVWALLCFFLWL